MTEKSYRDFDGINGKPTEFEWNIFPGFTKLQLCIKVNDLLSDLGEAPETFTGRILFMSMFKDISCDRKGNKEECLANARVVKVLAKKFGIGQWSFIGPGSETKWYLLLEFAESGHPIFRATTPLSRGKLKSKGHGKLSIHFTADYPTIETVFRIIISANQLSICGAVAEMCEEFEAHQDRSGELDVLMGQSIVLGEIKAEVPLQNEDPSHHQILWQQYEERIKSLSQESKVSKFCMDAAYVHVVEVGQYCMTKDTGDFRQFCSVACREYTLHRDDPASQPEGWIQGNMRIGPVLEVTTSYMYGKHGIEIRIWSVAQDNSHSKVRISYGTNKYVIDSNHNNAEAPANPHEEQAPQTSVKVIAARSKAKAKPQKREPVDVPSIIPMHERKWFDIEPSEPSLAAYEVSKKVISLLRHNQTVQREEYGAIQFWRVEFHLRNQFSQAQHWSDERWKACLAAEEEVQKEDISIALIIWEQFFTSVLFRDTPDVISLIFCCKTM